MHAPWFIPDYAGNGFLNLMASLVEASGGRPRHAPLASLSQRELRSATNLVLLIVDGLGDQYVRAYGPGGALDSHRRKPISAVFPSTTATAITTSYTGASPIEHGLTGWFTYFGEAGCVGAPLPFRRRGEARPIPASSRRLFREAPLLDGLASRPVVVTERSIIDSIYNLHHCGRAERRPYDRLEELMAEIAAAAKSGPERKFIYSYWPLFDRLSHEHGVGSDPVRQHFAEVDRAFAALLESLAGTDTLVVVTADHGFMDSPAKRSLSLPTALAAMLRFPLCGERRIVFAHAHSAREFMAKARDWLGDRAEVRASRELQDEGWFGTGIPHPRFAERIGDVAILMTDDWTLKDWVTGEPRHLHIGNHGGATRAEMLIPLVVATA
ncbi:MAG: alkaline phosphatase family protein [Proteobacteria bacterium]|nr:alkaline phosphatase family protein [Pseudomonadota bacterium]MDA0983700.1 alkaline phosphatase family protein [Pseudomonadota bacterium]